MRNITLILLIICLFGGFCYVQEPDTMIRINPEIRPTFKYDTCSNEYESLKKYFMDN